MTFSQLNHQSSSLSQINVGKDATAHDLTIAPSESTARSLLFIDSGVGDIQTLVNGAAPGTEVHVL
jgi:hypothetical protein